MKNVSDHKIELIIEKLTKDLRLAALMLIVFAAIPALIRFDFRTFIFGLIFFGIFCMPGFIIQILRIIELKYQMFKDVEGMLIRNYVSKPKGIISYHGFHFEGRFLRHRDVLNEYSEFQKGKVQMIKTGMTRIIVELDWRETIAIRDSKTIND